MFTKVPLGNCLKLWYSDALEVQELEEQEKLFSENSLKIRNEGSDKIPIGVMCRKNNNFNDPLLFSSSTPAVRGGGRFERLNNQESSFNEEEDRLEGGDEREEEEEDEDLESEEEESDYGDLHGTEEILDAPFNRAFME
jgi:hypothetical protein